jgi:HTH-type transcriptional regulator/antitoxin HipB
MRIASARDLGFFVRQSRQDRGLTQAGLAVEAGVSRRGLSDLEAGKASAEFGLVLRALHALGIGLDASPIGSGSGGVDLDALLDDFGGERA